MKLTGKGVQAWSPAFNLSLHEGEGKKKDEECLKIPNTMAKGDLRIKISCLHAAPLYNLHNGGTCSHQGNIQGKQIMYWKDYSGSYPARAQIHFLSVVYIFTGTNL